GLLVGARHARAGGAAAQGASASVGSSRQSARLRVGEFSRRGRAARDRSLVGHPVRGSSRSEDVDVPARIRALRARGRAHSRPRESSGRQMRPAVGDVIGGKYRIVRLIGDGGMGTVYEARHEFLETSVALKFLHADLAKRAGLGSRFLQEARVSAQIRSPHVTHVTDVDQTADGSPYLVMELLHGEPLQQAMDRMHKLPPEQAVDFALQILSGLEAAHAIGVVHRDLKPDNVFIVPAGGGPLLKLIDFGIAKLRASTEFQKGLTRAGVIMGTPEY